MKPRLALRKFDIKKGVFRDPLIQTELDKYKAGSGEWNEANARYLENLRLDPLSNLSPSQKAFLASRPRDLTTVLMERDINQLRWLGPVDQLPNESALHYKYRKEVIKLEAQIGVLKRIHFYNGAWHPREVGQWGGTYDVLMDKLKKAKANLTSIQEGMPPADLAMVYGSGLSIASAIPLSVEERAQKIRERIELERLQENASRVQGEKLAAQFAEYSATAQKLYQEQMAKAEEDATIIRGWMTVMEVTMAVVQPIMKTVAVAFSAVPGVGPFVTAGLLVTLELVNGARIDDALIAGIGGLVPGGAIGHAAFNVGVAVAKGKDVLAAGLGALPIPVEAQKAVGSAYAIVKDAAEGKPLTESAVNAAVDNLPTASRFVVNLAKTKGPIAAADAIIDQVGKYLPPEAQKALAVGIGVGRAAIEQAKTLAQNSLIPDKVKEYLEAGKYLTLADPIRREAYKLLPENARKGYDLAVGIYEYRHRYQNALTVYLEEARKTLNEAERKAFDMAVAQIIGKETPQVLKSRLERQERMKKLFGDHDMIAFTPPREKIVQAIAAVSEPPPKATEAEIAGFQVAQGLAGRGTVKERTDVMNIVAQEPETWKGATAVAADIKAKAPESVWTWILRFFGLR